MTKPKAALIKIAHKPMVLAIDDTPAILDFVRNVLEPDGYETLVAVNGERGIERARAELPDIILLDAMMPGLDGYRACAELKSDPATSYIPIVFMSAMASGLDVAKAFALGAADYVTKPVEPAELLARVRSQLALSELSARKERESSELAALVEERTADLSLALRERDAYLREINHRVRNNLQLMQSIIGQQIDADATASEALGKLLGRVESFSQAYDQLWSKKRLDGVLMREYLGKIVESTLDNRRGVSIKAILHIEAEPFPLDAALPCGLIVHELVDNSALHAFGPAGGKVRIELLPDGEAYRLSVIDDGKGCTDPLASTSGLGIRFVEALSDQLKGRLSLDGSRGFSASVFFGKPERPLDRPIV